MASLELIRYSPHRAEISDDRVVWSKAKGQGNILGLPQIIWANHKPWREANLWALNYASHRKNSLKTVLSAMKHICAYAKWLEAEDIQWWHFPDREADRCLVRYRGYLIDSRDRGDIAPSTTQQRMGAVIRLYRWFAHSGLIAKDSSMWREKQIGIRVQDSFGFERTIIRQSTDLAIPNRKIVGDVLEDGLLPVSSSDVPTILKFTDEHASRELTLMLHLGFNTGMRLGTILDLKVTTLERAVPDPSFRGYCLLSVGPGAHPPVHTKFGVTGHVFISTKMLEALKEYKFSTRRLKRQALAADEHKDHLFLNRFGIPYSVGKNEISKSIHIELGRLRKAGLGMGIVSFRNFHFHQSRCTFATELARVSIKHGGVSIAIGLVMRALLHKNESTSLAYIRFVEKTPIMAKVSNEFTRSFLGMFSPEATEDA